VQVLQDRRELAPYSLGRPVFVSESPRRAQLARWSGRIGGLAALAYIVVTVASLVGAPWVPRLALPGVGAVTANQAPDNATKLVTESMSAPASRTASHPRTSSPDVAPLTSSDAPSVGAATLPGNSGAAPRRADAVPNESNSAPGQSESAPGQSGAAPGQSTEAPGHSSSAPGRSGEAPGQSADAHGKSADAPGQSDDGPGHSENARGNPRH
jgi:hypothetical protein